MWLGINDARTVVFSWSCCCCCWWWWCYCCRSLPVKFYSQNDPGLQAKCSSNLSFASLQFDRRPFDRRVRFYFYRASAVAASPVLATIGMSVRLSVCPSVRPSVTRWHWVKTTQARITKSSPTDSTMTLVFGVKKFIKKFERVHPERGR